MLTEKYNVEQDLLDASCARVSNPGPRQSTRAIVLGHISTKKHEISRAFSQRKHELLNWCSFGRFPQKQVLFSKARATVSRAVYGLEYYLALFKARAYQTSLF
jgi:hypothetical protein